MSIARIERWIVSDHQEHAIQYLIVSVLVAAACWKHLIWPRLKGFGRRTTEEPDD